MLVRTGVIVGVGSSRVAAVGEGGGISVRGSEVAVTKVVAGITVTIGGMKAAD